MRLYHLFSTSSSLLRHLAATFRFPFRFTRSLFAPFSSPPLNHATNPAHFRDRQDRRRERTVKWDKQVWRERFETNTLNRELYPALHPFVIESCSPQKKRSLHSLRFPISFSAASWNIALFKVFHALLNTELRDRRWIPFIYFKLNGYISVEQLWREWKQIRKFVYKKYRQK